MFNWLRRLTLRKSPRQTRGGDDIFRIIAEIQQAAVPPLPPTYRIEFNDYCAESGLAILPIDETTPEGELRSLFHSYFATRIFGGLRLGKAMQLEIGFIGDPNLNAWAAAHDGVDLIGINTGMLIVLDAATKGLLSHPYLFPDVGDVTRCSPRVFPSEIAFPPLDARMWNAAPLECPERDRMASRIWGVALSYMVEHEFAHIWNGHVDYGSERLGLTRRAEVGASVGLDIQALELDADRSAATELLRFSLQPKIEIRTDKVMWHIPDSTAHGPTARSIEMCAVAAALFGFLTGNSYEVDHFDDEDARHPPAIARSICNLVTIARVLRQFAGWERAKTSEILDPVTEAMIDSIKGILPGGMWKFDKATFPDKIDRVMLEYDRAFSAIRPELRPFARGRMLETENPFFA